MNEQATIIKSEVLGEYMLTNRTTYLNNIEIESTELTTISLDYIKTSTEEETNEK
jgi:hypothetical protein